MAGAGRKRGVMRHGRSRTEAQGDEPKRRRMEAHADEPKQERQEKLCRQDAGQGAEERQFPGVRESADRG